MAENVKTVQGLAIASVKTLQGLAIASAKTIMGVDNTGGAPDWIDVMTVAGADSSESSGGSAQLTRAHAISLGAGEVSKFRIYSYDPFFNFNCSVKAALYDNSNNIVGTTSDYGSVTITAGNQYFEITFATPPTVSAGTYKIAWIANNDGATFRFLNSTGTVQETFDHTYAAFPPSSLTGLGNVSKSFVVSVYAVGP